MFLLKNSFISYLLSLVVLSVPAFAALDTFEIDKICKKDVLDAKDLAAIDKFVAYSIDRMLTVEDFSMIGDIRMTIVGRAHSTHSSADIQYNPQFSAAMAKNLSRAFEKIKQMSEPDKKATLNMNFLILLDNLHDMRLADFSIKMLDNENVCVRYWAVRSLTNSAALEQFNTSKAPPDLLQTLLRNFSQSMASENSPEIIEQIAQFCAAINSPEVHNLLFQIADARIKRYETCTVDNTAVDGTILKLLAEKITPGSDTAGIARRFGQLYSYTMQLYIKNKNVLGSAKKAELASTLALTETRALGRLGISQSGIKKALERDNEQAVQSEHDALFGDGKTAGRLSSVVNIEYVNPDGSKRTWPAELPACPTQKQ